MKHWIGIFLLMAVAACGAGPDDAAPQERAGDTDGGSFFKSLLPSRAEDPPLLAAELAGGDIRVRAPEGYCLDAASLRKRGKPFAMVASCRRLTDDKAGAHVEPALMTLTVGPPGSGQAPVTSGDLAGALAGVEVLRAETVEGLQLVQLAKGGDTFVPDGDPVHWRGALSLGDRIISLALYAPKGGDASGRLGAHLLSEFARALREANKDAVTGGDPAKEVATTQKPTNGIGGLLRRLLN